MPGRGETPSLDALYSELIKLPASVPAARQFLLARSLDESDLIALLRRAVPVVFLETLAGMLPWSERPRVLGAIVLNPRTPRPLAQRLLPVLSWRDLAEAARSPRVEAGIRARAEGLLKEKLQELRLGEKITLARFATPGVLRELIHESEPKVVDALLVNPKLREADVVFAVESDTAAPTLLERVAESRRWRESYAVRLALVLQPRAPVGVALAQLTSLLERDLDRVGATEGLRDLVRAAALRVAQEGRRR